MKLANCPQCGAQVKFHAANSVLAVCEYCSSTLLRHGEALEHIGKMAELQDDPTLLQIGSEGVYKGVHFGVIGRIQMQYEAGLWNEWHIMFDDMKTGWLGEAAGEFYVTFEKTLPLQPPPFSAIKVEDKIDIGGRYFEVSNLESATCIAGQGELPFTVGPGYEAPVADLKLDDEFATIDYSDDPPRIFVGEAIKVRDLKLSNLRDPRDAPDVLAPKHKAEAFNCPSCAAPFTLSSGKILTYGCASCGAVLDTANNKVQLISKAQEAMNYPLRIPLGAKGKITTGKINTGKPNRAKPDNDKAETREFEIIGHMRRGSEAGFSWSEYLLFNPDDGYRWLSESDGHWTLAQVTNRSPKVLGLTAYHQGENYDHFQHYSSTVLHVLGEFYWKVKVDDSAEVDDYIAPPHIISREKTKNEVSWSAGDYVTPDWVQQTFNVKTPMPPPKGIAPNQPSPWNETNPQLWKRFGILSAIAFTLQLWFAITTQTVHKESVAILPKSELSITTQPFKVSGNGNLAVSSEAALDNSWAALGLTLVDPATGRVWRAEQQLEHYSGRDEDGDSWSEGSKSGLVMFSDVPAGTYQLQVDGEIPRDATGAVSATLKLERGHASWLNWVLVQIILLLMPLIAWWRTRAFEVQRWADSDHPRDGGGDDDDD